MIEKVLSTLERIARLYAIDPLGAADELDRLSDIIKETATKMRESALTRISPGAIGDSCKIQVSGPDGIIKQSTNTKG